MTPWSTAGSETPTSTASILAAAAAAACSSPLRAATCVSRSGSLANKSAVASSMPAGNPLNATRSSCPCRDIAVKAARRAGSNSEPSACRSLSSAVKVSAGGSGTLASAASTAVFWAAESDFRSSGSSNGPAPGTFNWLISRTASGQLACWSARDSTPIIAGTATSGRRSRRSISSVFRTSSGRSWLRTASSNSGIAVSGSRLS